MDYLSEYEKHLDRLLLSYKMLGLESFNLVPRMENLSGLDRVTMVQLAQKKYHETFAEDINRAQSFIIKQKTEAFVALKEEREALDYLNNLDVYDTILISKNIDYFISRGKTENEDTFIVEHLLIQKQSLINFQIDEKLKYLENQTAGIGPQIKAPLHTKRYSSN